MNYTYFVNVMLKLLNKLKTKRDSCNRSLQVEIDKKYNAFYPQLFTTVLPFSGLRKFSFSLEAFSVKYKLKKLPWLLTSFSSSVGRAWACKDEFLGSIHTYSFSFFSFHLPIFLFWASKPVV